MNEQEPKIQEILALCSRDQEHETMQIALTCAVEGLHNWAGLIHEAELHGVAPLIYKHLININTKIPQQHKQVLQGLYLRHRRANTIRKKALREMLITLNQAQIGVLLIKGSALCNLLYSDIGLRPMRDIDILVRKEEAPAAEALLIEQGYHQEPYSHIPDGHYHLDPLLKQVGGMEVNVEIHHNLLPFLPGYPLRPFDDLLSAAISFNLDGVQAMSLGYEDMLWYVYQHGFGMPLSYGTFRFMHAADLITLVEKQLDQIDWLSIQTKHPQITNILTALHYVSPWSDRVLKTLKLPVGKKPNGVGKPFTGWPCRHIRDLQGESLFSLIKETLLPPTWWLYIHYGRGPGFSQLRTLIWDHPRNVFWWFRIYWPLFRESHLNFSKK
jgi:hypothetical protein